MAQLADAFAGVGAPGVDWRRRQNALDRIFELEADDLVSATLLLLDAAGSGWVGATLVVLRDIGARRPKLTADDSLLALRLVNRIATNNAFGEYLPMIIANVERHSAKGAALFETELRATLAALEVERAYPAELVRIRARVRTLLPSGDALDLTPIVPVDPWGRLVRSHLQDRFEASKELNELLRLLADATSPAPTKKWRERWIALLRALPTSRDVVRLMLEDLLVAEANPGAQPWDRLQRLIDLRNHDVARGAAWGVGLSPAPTSVALLGDVGIRTAGVSDKVANACVQMLMELRTKDAVAQLARMRATIKQQGLLKLIRRALDSVAHWQEVSTFELIESSVPPSVAAERVRLEELLAADHEWTVERWCPLYVAHPVTGTIARDLIWSVEIDSAWSSAFPGAAAGEFLLRDGTSRRLAPGALVRAWHPSLAARSEVVEWRRYVVERQLHQPFKQAFREVYQLGDDERSEVSALCFAGHILRYQRMFALLKERRWANNYLGPWDQGYEGKARRDFEWVGLSAFFSFEQVSGDAGAFPIPLCSTKELQFVRRDDRSGAPLRLRDVPAAVLSEACRDVDLFVSMCSIAAANDEVAWDDPRFGRFSGYRDSLEERTGPLERTRVAAIEHALPRLPVADRCRLAGRELLVRGDRAAYRIDVGTGRVRSGAARHDLPIAESLLPPLEASALYLPFDDDAILHRILRTVLFLGRDGDITDVETLRRIRAD